MNETWQNILNSLGDWVLKVVGFLVILLVGWIISRFIGRIIDRALAKIGFNRMAERTGLRRWTGSYEPSALVGRIAYYAALLFTFQIAFNVFGPNPVTAIIDTIIAWLPRLLVAAVIMVVTIAIANAVFDIIRNALAQFSYGKTLGRIAQIGIIVLGAIAALNQIGIAMTVTMPVLIAALATVAGILIVGVGGGMVRPMQERWERMLNRAESETTRLSEHRARTARDGMKPAGDGGMTQPAYQGREADRDLKSGAQKAADKAEQQVRGETPR